MKAPAGSGRSSHAPAVRLRASRCLTVVPRGPRVLTSTKDRPESAYVRGADLEAPAASAGGEVEAGERRVVVVGGLVAEVPVPVDLQRPGVRPGARRARARPGRRRRRTCGRHASAAGPLPRARRGRRTGTPPARSRPRPARGPPRLRPLEPYVDDGRVVRRGRRAARSPGARRPPSGPLEMRHQRRLVGERACRAPSAADGSGRKSAGGQRPTSRATIKRHQDERRTDRVGAEPAEQAERERGEVVRDLVLVQLSSSAAG